MSAINLGMEYDSADWQQRAGINGPMAFPLEFERSTKKRIDPVPDFTSTISADPKSDLIYQGTHVVTCKRHLDHEFFAKYMLKIGHLTYCTTVSKSYLYLFVFSLFYFNKLNTFMKFLLDPDCCQLAVWHVMHQAPSGNCIA